MKPSGPSGSVIAAAIAGILAGLFGVLIAVLAIVGFSLMQPANSAPLPPYAKSISVAMMLLFCAVAIFGIVTSVGVLRLKRWARISMLVWGGAMAGFCGLAMLFMIFVPLPEMAGNSALNTQGLRLLVSMVYAVPVLIGLWWLVLFTRPGVKEQFMNAGADEGQALAAPLPRCPLPLAILAGFSIFSAGSSLLILPLVHLPVNMILFGHRFHGAAGVFFLLLSAGLLMAGSVGLLKLQRWSYPLMLGQYFFWMASGTISLVSPNFDRNVQEVFSQMNLPEGPATQAAFVQTRTFGILTLLPSVLLVWLLLYCHTRFMKACAAKEAQRQS